MNSLDFEHWQKANRDYLMASLAIVRNRLTSYIATKEEQTENRNQHLEESLQQAAEALPRPSTLENLCGLFKLSSFEREVLLLCVGLELDPRFIPLCGGGTVNSRPYVTFSLALSALPDAHWNALAPTSPLRYWRLLEVTNQEVLALSPLRLDERILHYVTGTFYLDTRLRGLVERVPVPETLPPSQQKLVQHLIELWGKRKSEDPWIVVQLCGKDAIIQKEIAALACHKCGLKLQVMRAKELSASLAEREALIRLWEREAFLSTSALLLDCEGLDASETARAVSFVEQLQSPLLVASREPLPIKERVFVRLDLAKPSTAEQEQIWQQELGSFAEEINGQIEPLVMQFNLNAQRIRAACLDFKVQYPSWVNSGLDKEMIESLWDACRSQSRPSLEQLAQRIQPAATWEELVLPDQQKQILREIAAHVRQRGKVYQTWDFASKGARGLGISALFAGISGTGKTMAAEVLAQELRLDLYRIDLSSVVSKYIGETEKNLRRVFDAAESGGAILLFDEADALFGKRSEIKDSHDRYANIEVSYLLQRMEAYRGLAVLTTNLKEALDTAFLRRIRFVVQFPFPDAAQRREIWRRIFPENTPREGLDLERLGRLNVAGGNIRNIALNAAFLAADGGEAVQMKHLLAAARSEYMKLEKSLTDTEVGDWL